MKHLQTFENFNQEDRQSYDTLVSNQEKLETSSSFSEMPKNEQEILSNVYSKESETISDANESNKWEYALTNGKKIIWHKVTADTEQEAQKKASKHADDLGERIYAGVLKVKDKSSKQFNKTNQ